MCSLSNIPAELPSHTEIRGLQLKYCSLLCVSQTLVGRLLAERVDIAITDTQGRTALLHSVIRKHDGITDLILAHHSALVRSRLNERNNSKRWGRSSSGNRGGGEDAGMGEGSGVPEAVSDLQVHTCCCGISFGVTALGSLSEFIYAIIVHIYLSPGEHWAGTPRPENILKYTEFSVK